MRSHRIINSRSSGVETTEVEVLYEKQQGLKHTHTVGCHGTGTISHTHIRRPHLYNTYSSPVLIPLNRSSSSLAPPSFSHTIPLLSISSLQPIGSRGLSRQTPLSPTALPRLKLKSFFFRSSHPLFFFFYWHKSGGSTGRDWWPSSPVRGALRPL